MRLAKLAIVLAAVLAGCNAGPTYIDGYRIGELARCDDGCRQEIEFAVRWLDGEHPSHPELDHVEIHVTDGRTRDGAQILSMRSGGGTYIAVFVFADGSRAAVGVGCGVGIDPTMCFTAPPSAFDL